MAISSFLYGLFQNKEYLVLNGLQEVNALCYVGTKISKAAKNFSTNNFHTFWGYCRIIYLRWREIAWLSYKI